MAFAPRISPSVWDKITVLSSSPRRQRSANFHSAMPTVLRRGHQQSETRAEDLRRREGGVEHCSADNMERGPQLYRRLDRRDVLSMNPTGLLREHALHAPRALSNVSGTPLLDSFENVSPIHRRIAAGRLHVVGAAMLDASLALAEDLQPSFSDCWWPRRGLLGIAEWNLPIVAAVGDEERYGDLVHNTDE